jgi:hypothetical protein
VDPSNVGERQEMEMMAMNDWSFSATAESVIGVLLVVTIVVMLFV